MAQYTLTAACTLIDKIRSIKRAIAIHSGVLKTVRSERLEDLRTCVVSACIVVKKNEYVYFACSESLYVVCSMGQCDNIVRTVQYAVSIGDDCLQDSDRVSGQNR